MNIKEEFKTAISKMTINQICSELNITKTQAATIKIVYLKSEKSVNVRVDLDSFLDFLDKRSTLTEMVGDRSVSNR